MKRTTERWIWASVVVLLLAIGAVLFLGPAGRMMSMCEEMMGGGMMPDSGIRQSKPRAP